MKLPVIVDPKATRKTVFTDLNGKDFVSQAEAKNSNKTIRMGLFVQALDGYFSKFLVDESDPRTEDNNKLVQTIKFDLADNLGNNAEGVMKLIDDVFQKIEKLNGAK